MKRVVPILIAQLLFAVALPARAQQKAEPQNKMVKFHMALLKRDPNAPNNNAPASKLMDEHKAYVLSLLESGKAVIAGPMAKEGVQAGRLALEIHPWLVPEGILP